ncbi:MAG TPA: hypothetical protein PL009_09450 [Flavipsychrobacter sp.]|nr:hypothetical protein [Flavipsychrobacter sp.]
MENTAVSLVAIHESARIVFAYLNGYWCDKVTVEGTSGENSGAQLNPGNDLSVVQHILSGRKPSAMSESEKDHAVKTAKKLMAIYCAGACAGTFFQNDEQLPDELNMEIPATDLRNIEKIQSFLKAAVYDHSDDYPTEVLISVLKKLDRAETWKPIKALAQKLMESENGSLTSFYIEDTLMMHGIKRQKHTSSAGFVVGVAEDKSEKKQQSSSATITATSTLQNQDTLDAKLTEFLQMVKRDWAEEELQASVVYLKKLFAKYGETR